MLEPHRGVPPVQHGRGVRQHLALQPPEPSIAVAQHGRGRVRGHACCGERLPQGLGRSRLAIPGKGEAVLNPLGIDHLARDHLEVAPLLGSSAAHVATIEPDHDGSERPHLGPLRGGGQGWLHHLLADRAERDLERAKWRLWHGRWAGCRDRLAALLRWTSRKDVYEAAGIDRLQRHVTNLLGYLERNAGALVPYAARRRRGQPISTAFVESAVNEIVAKRMTKRQQMRWDGATVQPFLDVRTAVLNGALEDAFRRRYPGFRPANDEAALPAAA